MLPRMMLLVLLLSAAVVGAPPRRPTPPELQWFSHLTGVTTLGINDYNTAGWEGSYSFVGNGFALMDQIRTWMEHNGWKVEDQNASSGGPHSGVLSRRLDGKKSSRKLAVTATQQSGQEGRLRVGLMEH